jgi:glycerol-3-phosphate acyltransferase PlsY
VVAFVFRYSSLAAIVTAVSAPVYQLLLWGGGPVAVTITVMGLLLVWRHSANIRKLMQGTESKLGRKAAAPVHPSPKDGPKDSRKDTHSRPHHGAKR